MPAWTRDRPVQRAELEAAALQAAGEVLAPVAVIEGGDAGVDHLPLRHRRLEIGEVVGQVAPARQRVLDHVIAERASDRVSSLNFLCRSQVRVRPCGPNSSIATATA